NRTILPPNLFTILIIILVEMNRTITIINETLLAIIVEVKDTLLKIVAVEEKIIGITLTLTTDIATTLIITLALMMVIAQVIERIIIIALMIILDLKVEIDHMITTDYIEILDIIIDPKAKKEVNQEIDIEAIIRAMKTETDLEADPQPLTLEKLML